MFGDLPIKSDSEFQDQDEQGSQHEAMQKLNVTTTEEIESKQTLKEIPVVTGKTIDTVEEENLIQGSHRREQEMVRKYAAVLHKELSLPSMRMILKDEKINKSFSKEYLFKEGPFRNYKKPPIPPKPRKRCLSLEDRRKLDLANETNTGNRYESQCQPK